MTAKQRIEALRFSLATPADDAALRRLLRETPMEGRIQVAFAREPSFIEASEVEGPVHQTIVACTPSGETVGLCGRSVRPMWVNGERRSVGYLSALRLAPSFRGRPRTLKLGFAAVRALHDKDRLTPYYLSTIIQDNQPARRVLEKELPGFPSYLPKGELVTLALPTWRRRRARSPEGLSLRAATEQDWPAIRACLARAAPRYHFRPDWDAENLGLCRALGAGDFTLALRDDAVVGCVALWDQRSFKQSVVAGYSGFLGTFRWLINLLAPLLGVPRLPPPGGTLDGAMLSHLAVDGDDLAVALALLARAHEAAVGRFGTLTLGLPARHPWTAEVKAHFGAIEYRSLVYAVAWEDGLDAARALDERLCWPEVAVL